MKKLFNILKEICYRLNLIDDYIVERGTATNDYGTWTYRKWNSGDAECWGRMRGTGPTPSGLLGFYYTYIDVDLPFTFGSSYIAYGESYLGTGLGFFNYSMASYSRVRLYSTGSQNIASISVNAHVLGKWK